MALFAPQPLGLMGSQRTITLPLADAHGLLVLPPVGPGTGHMGSSRGQRRLNKSRRRRRVINIRLRRIKRLGNINRLGRGRIPRHVAAVRLRIRSGVAAGATSVAIAEGHSGAASQGQAS
jgi:hypothetical protein